LCSISNTIHRTARRNSAYAKARRDFRKAAAETGLPISSFPEECPFTSEQVLDPDFLP
jgi:hypothetical protein